MSVEGFNYDNVLIRLLNRVGDVMILSVLFVLTSLPLITIGASITALYYTTMKSLEIEDGYIAKFYFKSFKDNFKQSTIIWLISVLVLFVLGFDVYFWYYQWKHGTMGQAGQAMTIVSIIILSVAIMVVMYVFPLQAKFDNSIKVQFRNAFLLSIKYFPTTLLLALISAIIVWGFYYQFALCFIGFILFGFGVAGYVYGFFMLKCFKPFLQPKRAVEDEGDFHLQDEEADEIDEEDDTDEEQSEDEDDTVEEATVEPQGEEETQEPEED